MRHARAAIARGELVVFPTDTVYGVAADAFRPDAVQRLLDAKGRTRQSPPPVLVGDVSVLSALADSVPARVHDLVAACWPGPLTLVLQANPGLRWDLGETQGTVALRMPNHPLALAVLAETGPLAVSSANVTGEPAATTAAEAERSLGDRVAVILSADADQDATPDADPDANPDADPAATPAAAHPAPGHPAPAHPAPAHPAPAHPAAAMRGALSGISSTIVDARGLTDEGGTLSVLRLGGCTVAELEAALPGVLVR